ncbi:MAG: N-acetyltransferase [Micropepsaceae bacterium]
MIVFRATPSSADIEAVRQLVADTGVFSRIEVGWAAEIIETALKNPATCGYFFLFADGTNGLEGYTCYGPIDGTENRFDLYWIAVSPKAQGKGLGRKLLAESVLKARRQGATHLFIDTSTRSDYSAARTLYTSQGFEQMGMLVDFYSDGDSKALFGRKL